jgi:hypothetical protein
MVDCCRNRSSILVSNPRGTPVYPGVAACNTATNAIRTWGLRLVTLVALWHRQPLCLRTAGARTRCLLARSSATCTPRARIAEPASRVVRIARCRFPASSHRPPSPGLQPKPKPKPKPHPAPITRLHRAPGYPEQVTRGGAALVAPQDCAEARLEGLQSAHADPRHRGPSTHATAPARRRNHPCAIMSRASGGRKVIALRRASYDARSDARCPPPPLARAMCGLHKAIYASMATVPSAPGLAGSKRSCGGRARCRAPARTALPPAGRGALD